MFSVLLIETHYLISNFKEHNKVKKKKNIYIHTLCKQCLNWKKK